MLLAAAAAAASMPRGIRRRVGRHSVRATLPALRVQPAVIRRAGGNAGRLKESAFIYLENVRVFCFSTRSIARRLLRNSVVIALRFSTILQ